MNPGLEAQDGLWSRQLGIARGTVFYLIGYVVVITAMYSATDR